MNLLTFAAIGLLSLGAFGVASAQNSSPLPDGASQAQLVKPAKAPMNIAIDGRIWQCSGTSCSADVSDAAESQSVPRECRRAAVILGPFASYQTGSKTLTSTQLQACDQGLTKS